MRVMPRRRFLQAVAASAAAAGCVRRAAAAGRPSLLVVGSGIAGLSAAWELQNSGFDVTVFEKNNIAGGRMIEAWVGPLFGSVHASALYEGSREMWALAEDLGLAAELDGQPDGDIWGFPVDNGHGTYTVATRMHLTEMLNVPGLSAATRLRLPALFPELAAIRSEVDPCLLATGERWDRESLWEYCVRTVGSDAAREIMDYWLEPALMWPWSWRPDETSMIAPLAIAAQQHHRWIRPRAGIGFLTRRLAREVDVQLNTTVMQIAPADATGRHAVHYLTPEGERRVVTPDVVLCAVQGDFVSPIVAGLDDAERRFFDGIQTTKYAAVQYVLAPEHAPAHFMGGPGVTRNHADELRRRLAFGWSVEPPGEGRPAVLSLALSEDEEIRWRASGRSLADYCMPFAQALYPALTPEAVTDVIVRAGDNLARMPTGYIQAMARFLLTQERTRRGLYFAGEYLGNSFTGGACASGRTVARTIVRHWR